MPKVYSDYTNYLHRPMAYGDYTNYYHRQGLKPGDISRKLKQEGIKATGRGIAQFLAKCIKLGSVARKPGSGRPSKATAAVRTWATRGNVKTQRKYVTEPTVQRNGTERRTERNVPWNEPFLGKRCRRATQTERTVFRTIFRREPYLSFMQYQQIRSGLSDPFQGTLHPHLDYVMRGVKRRLAQLGIRARTRLPITPSLLYRLKGM